MQVDDVVETYLAEVAARGRYACTIALYEHDHNGQRVRVAVRGRWTPGEGLHRQNTRIAYERDALDSPLDAGQTVAITNVETDPRVNDTLREIQASEGRPALAFIPLMVRGFRIGVVILSAAEVHAWSDEDLRPYQATAAQLATAIDSRQQQSLLIERGQQLAVLEERQRLARELHDSVTQLIFSTTLIAQSIAPAWRRSPAEGEKRVTRLLELSQTALAEMRALLVELRPEASQLHDVRARATAEAEGAMPGLVRVQREGLAAAIERYARDVGREGIRIEVDATQYPSFRDDRERPQLVCEEGLYRIAQEALNNVVKHAHAHMARVVLAFDAGRGVIRLSVSDDGEGFVAGERSEEATSGGMGLKTMRERAEALRGAFDILSAPGRGTVIHVVAPWRAVQENAV
jgi:signal transduction histidine kinase